MSTLELDHVFCFCEPLASREVEIAERAGFTLTAGTRHQGQGTANRCILFQENYLEFIFVDAPADVKSDPTHLTARANWRKTGASPFGIGLRGTLSEQDKAKFWEYNPPYWPEGSIFVFNAAKELAAMPMIFMIPSAVRPADKKTASASLFAHKAGARMIQHVEVIGPSYSWPNLSTVAGVKFIDGKRHQMRAVIDGRLAEEINFNETLSISESG